MINWLLPLCLVLSTAEAKGNKSRPMSIFHLFFFRAFSLHLMIGLNEIQALLNNIVDLKMDLFELLMFTDMIKPHTQVC